MLKYFAFEKVNVKFEIMINNKITKICCIGAGYVGGPTMAVLAYKCNNVEITVLDVDENKIKLWNGDVKSL